MARGRWPLPVPKLAGRAWGAALAREIEEWMRRVGRAMSDLQRFPQTPTSIQAGVAAATGDGPAPAQDDHVHNIVTGAPPNPTGQVASEGTGAALMRAGATIKQGIVTTKGDLLTHSATLPDRLPVGTNAQVLVADSTQALGLKWVDSTSLVVDAAGDWARHFLLIGAGE